MRPKVLLATPLSGATSGIEAVTRMFLESPLAQAWEIRHVDTGTQQTNAHRGRLTLYGIQRIASVAYEFAEACRQSHYHAAIIQMAANRGGFLKFAILSSIARHWNIPVIGRFGGENFRDFLCWLSEPSRRVVMSVTGKCAAVLVEAQCLQRQFHGVVPRDRIRWAYLGVDPKQYPAITRLHRPFNLLYMGHISQAKGALDLLAAMPIIRKDILNVNLQMLGEPLIRERNILIPKASKQAWKNARSALSLAYVEPMGLLVGKDKPLALRNADLFICASHSEGLPVSVLEAMASGLPMVCTRVGALPEILKHAVNCLFVEPGDPGGLANAITSLADNGSRFRRTQMAVRNREAIEERFNLETFASGVVKAVGDIARQ